MNCAETKKLFSPYLDGRVSGSEMRALTRHMQQCAACSQACAAMQRTQQLLASLGPKQAPADLALKLRVVGSPHFSKPSSPQAFLQAITPNRGRNRCGRRRPRFGR